MERDRRVSQDELTQEKKGFKNWTKEKAKKALLVSFMIGPALLGIGLGAAALGSSAAPAITTFGTEWIVGDVIAAGAVNGGIPVAQGVWRDVRGESKSVATDLQTEQPRETRASSFSSFE